MKTYTVEITRTDYGSVEVEAKNKEEAYKKAIEEEEAGNAFWNKNTVEIEDIEIVN